MSSFCQRMCPTVPFAPLQSSFINKCAVMNDRADNLGRFAEGLSGLFTAIGSGARLRGSQSTSMDSAADIFGKLDSGISLARIPFDAVNLFSGNAFFEKAEPEVGTEVGADPTYKLKNPLTIIAQTALKTGRVIAGIRFLNNNGAISLNAPTAARVNKASTITWGIVSVAYVACAIQGLKSATSSLTDKVMDCVRSALDLIAWIFDTVATYSVPSLGIAGGVIHAVNGFTWFFSDLFSFGTG